MRTIGIVISILIECRQWDFIFGDWCRPNVFQGTFNFRLVLHRKFSLNWYKLRGCLSLWWNNGMFLWLFYLSHYFLIKNDLIISRKTFSATSESHSRTLPTSKDSHLINSLLFSLFLHLFPMFLIMAFNLLFSPSSYHFRNHPKIGHTLLYHWNM